MRFEFNGHVEVERESGKFASRDEIQEAIREALESALGDIDISSVGADGDSVYNVIDSDVTVT